MKKSVMMILTAILISSCSKSTISHSLKRIENNEVICYYFQKTNLIARPSGLQCFFKQSLIIKDSIDALDSTTNTTD